MGSQRRKQQAKNIAAAKARITKAYRLNDVALKAMQRLIIDGATPGDVSRELGVEPRTLYNWRKAWHHRFVNNNPVFWRIFTEQVGDSLKVYQAALAGHPITAMQMKAATRILQSAGILSRRPSLHIDQSKRLYQFGDRAPGDQGEPPAEDQRQLAEPLDTEAEVIEDDPQNIEVDPKPDDTFADQLPALLERIRRSVEVAGVQKTDMS